MRDETSPSSAPAAHFTWVEGAALALLASLASLTVIGYRFGDSNHGITVPILKKLIDPSLYPGDAMVATGDRFPTVFYRSLAAILPSTEWVPFAYFAGYVASMALAYAAVYRIGVFAGGGERAAGFLAVLLATTVRTQLGNESLYRVAFSHSHLASGLDLMAVALFLEGRRIVPLLILSFGVYVHALYSLYLLVPLTLAVLVEARTEPRRATVMRLVAAWAPTLPFLVLAIRQGEPMTAEWLALLRLRSAHHSFPSSFGPFLPDAVVWLLLGLAGAVRAGGARLGALATGLAATGLLFVFGTLFTEVLPVKAVLQFQPHRIWRFLAVLLLAFMAAEIVRFWRTSPLLRLFSAAYFLAIFAPGLEQLGPLVLIGALAARAAVAPPLPQWWSALVVVSLVALEWPDRTVAWTDYLVEFLRRLQNPAVFQALAAATLVSFALEARPGWRRALGSTALVLTCGPLMGDNYARQQARFEQGSFRDAQEWARLNTPKDAVFLTPPQEAGFRVFSERSIVGEWKDGTQQYFDDAFAREWGRRMELVMAREFGQFTDEEIVDLARRFGASYIVGQGRRRRLPIAHDAGSTVVYRVF